jgi:hypothetical protein
MIELPQCRWRGEEKDGRYLCRSHKLITPYGVDADICQRCPYKDHEEEPPEDYVATMQPLVTKALEPCVHLGEATGERVECPSCAGSVKIKLMACAVFTKCTPQTKLEGIACCLGCARYEEKPAAPSCEVIQ